MASTTSKQPQNSSPNSAENKFYRYILTCCSALVAESLTFPLDITKTRLQLQNELVAKGTPQQYRGMIQTALGIVREEGFSGLYQGLPPALLRHIVYSGMRIGFYEQIRELFRGKDGDFSLWKKALAGATSGALAQLVASPTDLVKVRMQAQRRKTLESQLGITKQVKKNIEISLKFQAVDSTRMYRGTIHAFSTIIKQEGILGLWKGVGPNVQRAALVNLGELATYDQSKELIIKSGIFSDGLTTHTIAGILSGFVFATNFALKVRLAAAVASCPADVVKTRMMNQYMSSTSQRLYRNSFDCLVKSIQAEGFLSMYKGFLPTWARLGPWQLTFWIVYEQLRRITGVGTF